MTDKQIEEAFRDLIAFTENLKALVEDMQDAIKEFQKRLKEGV